LLASIELVKLQAGIIIALRFVCIVITLNIIINLTCGLCDSAYLPTHVLSYIKCYTHLHESRISGLNIMAKL